MFELKIYEDTSQIHTPMQFEEGTVIASLLSDDYSLEIRVKGSSKIIFKGKEYTSFEEYPEKIKEKMKKYFNWWEDQDLVVNQRSYFEIICKKQRNDIEYKDIVGVEEYSEVEVLKLFLRIIGKYQKEVEGK